MNSGPEAWQKAPFPVCAIMQAPDILSLIMLLLFAYIQRHCNQSSYTVRQKAIFLWNTVSKPYYEQVTRAKLFNAYKTNAHLFAGYRQSLLSKLKPGMVPQTCNPSIQEMETGGSAVSLLHSEFEASVKYMRPCLQTKQTKREKTITKSLENLTAQEFPNNGIIHGWLKTLVLQRLSSVRIVNKAWYHSGFPVFNRWYLYNVPITNIMGDFFYCFAIPPKWKVWNTMELHTRVYNL